MSSGRVIVRACWGGTCAMDGWNRRGRCLVAPRIDVDRGAKRRGRPPVKRGGARPGRAGGGLGGGGGGGPCVVMVGAPAVLRGDGRYGAITVGSHTRVRH